MAAVLRLQVLADAGDRAAGADAGHEVGDPAGGLRARSPARCCGRATRGSPGCGTGWAGRRRGSPRSGGWPRSSRSPGGRRHRRRADDHLGAVGPQQLDLLLAHLVGHDEDAAVAARAATMASPTPVLPDVGSTIVPPGWRSPAGSAASTMASAGRSFTLPPALRNSHLASTVAVEPLADTVEADERRVPDQIARCARRSACGDRAHPGCAPASGLAPSGAFNVLDPLPRTLTSARRAGPSHRSARSIRTSSQIGPEVRPPRPPRAEGTGRHGPAGELHVGVADVPSACTAGAACSANAGPAAGRRPCARRASTRTSARRRRSAISMPDTRGEPSARSVAMIFATFRSRIRRTSAANSGSVRSNSRPCGHGAQRAADPDSFRHERHRAPELPAGRVVRRHHRSHWRKTMPEAVIVAAARSPIGRADKGSLVGDAPRRPDRADGAGRARPGARSSTRPRSTT